MKNSVSLAIVIIFALFSLFTAKTVLANQYEGVITPVNILIDKKISVPSDTITNAQDATYVDNLFDFNARFTPGQNIFFKIRVKNTSNIKLTNVQIKDFFPANFVETVGGPGTLDRTINPIAIVINVGNLEPDEERVFFIRLKALPQDRLPSGSLFCGAQGVVNRVQATADSSAFDDDTAQFCIEKQVLAEKVTTQVTEVSKGGIVTKIPSTGPELNLFLLSGEAIALALGIYLKKLSS